MLWLCLMISSCLRCVSRFFRNDVIDECSVFDLLFVCFRDFCVLWSVEFSLLFCCCRVLCFLFNLRCSKRSFAMTAFFILSFSCKFFIVIVLVLKLCLIFVICDWVLMRDFDCWLCFVYMMLYVCLVCLILFFVFCNFCRKLTIWDCRLWMLFFNFFWWCIVVVMFVNNFVCFWLRFFICIFCLICLCL